MNKKTVKDIELTRKRVLMRVDFNVPMEGGRITDDQRIAASLPTIEYVLNQAASLILMSHLGRPKRGRDPDFSLKPAAQALARLLGKPVQMAPDCVGTETESMARDLKPGQVLMLENTRFQSGEEQNDLQFARHLASLADVYVNDAFGSAHRAHASTEGVTHFLPAVSGLLMEKELDYLGRATLNPEHPFIAILGGAKIDDKIGVVENLLPKCDRLIIGGGMANTFLAAKGFQMRESLVASRSILKATSFLTAAGEKILLPSDAVITEKLEPDARAEIVDVGKIPPGWRMLDIGPKTIKTFTEALRGARLIVWNGPMGVFEMPRFAAGTVALAKALADSGATTVIGGGDSASAVKQAGVAAKMSHISTGGGASLEFLEGRVLPGVAALQDKAVH